MTQLRTPSPTPSPQLSPQPAAQPSPQPAAPLAEPRVRRRRESHKHARRRRGLLSTGVALVLAGLVVLGYLAWQFWGSNWVSQGRQAEVTEALEAGWGQGSSSTATAWGEADAILRVSRFGEEYAVPILEGSTDEVLAAGVGHMEDTAEVGAKGNYALAAHRVTHGEPFADFPELREGDLVEVETRDAIYTYELDSSGTELIVPFTASWVLDAQPRNPDQLGISAPTDEGQRLITLLTCSEIFHTDNRSIVFGHLVDKATKIAGLS